MEHSPCERTRPSGIPRCPKGKTRPEGMALVITLIAVVLLTTLLLAFFSSSTLTRQIAFTSSNLIKADQLARAGAEIVVGELREEIRDGSWTPDATNQLSQSGVVVFQPKDEGSPDSLPYAAKYLVPQKINVDTPSDPLLLKVSGDNLPIRPGGSLTGSPISISAKSGNNRSISPAMWFSAGGPKLSSQSTLPTWMMVTRNSGVATPAISEAKDPASGNFVIGRFAYTVYDLSGLADANVAGAPASDPNMAFKRFPAYADLGPLGVSDTPALLAWRNADAASPSAYSSYLDEFAGPRGFREIRAGHNAFLSRRDLINAASSGSGAFPGEPSNFTHFSRSLNAPSFFPSSATAGNPVLPNVRFTAPGAPGAVTHYADDGAPETYDVLPGDPLLQRRFSLAKLAWLTPLGPKAGITATAIRACFGLQWDESEARWDYVGPSGATVQSSIKTLAEVAQEGREPNFFELLKAGILEDALGEQSGNETTTLIGARELEANKDLQILRIGANIIDCADNNNYPTILAMQATLDGVTSTIEAAGIEDLPYFYCKGRASVRNVTVVPTTTTEGEMTSNMLLFFPVLLNPHRPSPTAAATGPATVTCDLDGVMTKVFLNDNDPSTPMITDYDINTPIDLNSNEPSTGISNITDIPASGFRDGPDAPRESGASNSLSALAGNYAVRTEDADVQAFRLMDYRDYKASLPAHRIAANGNIKLPQLPLPPLNAQFYARFDYLMMRLRYTTPNGVTKTYACIAGNDAFADSTGYYGTSPTSPNTAFNPVLHAGLTDRTQANHLKFTGFAMPWDPRTTRFGLGSGQGRQVNAKPPSEAADPLNTSNAIVWGSPFAECATPISYGYWPEGGTGYGDVASPAGVRRLPDAYLGPAANPLRNLSDYSRRPVILQRPYRSVAELGYVFRDTPWKTLNFFHENSADAALLDLFSTVDEPRVTAGRVCLNTPMAPTLQSLLSQTSLRPDGTSPLPGADELADTFETFSYELGAPANDMAANIAGLARFQSEKEAAITTSGLGPVKYEREAVVRSLAGTTQTRTWNLLIDIVAQTGRFPQTATGLDKFVVEGEKRYWLSVAIDRYTGKVIDQQLEPVYE